MLARRRARVPAAPALRAAGIAPLTLEAKEGLALINGTQVSTALALHALLAFEPVLEAALVVGALTVDAARGSDGAVRSAHPRAARPAGPDRRRPVLPRAARRQRDPPLAPRGRRPGAGPVQPALPAAGGRRLPRLSCATRRGAACARPTRSPTTRWSSPDDGDEIVSGGNFHAEPVALAADAMALAIAEVGAIAERRIAMLIDAGVSRLPPFLTADPGLNSGFMIAHVTAASLASENKSLAHPASVDSLPTSANQEDHVSMATFAARRLQPMIANTAHILGIELLAAAQGVEFLRPLRQLGRARVGARAAARALPGDADRPLPGARHRERDRAGAGRLAGARLANPARAAGALVSGLISTLARKDLP